MARPKSKHESTSDTDVVGLHAKSPVETSVDGEVEPVTDVIRRDRVLESAQRIMRKHRATFASLAK